MYLFITANHENIHNLPLQKMKSSSAATAPRVNQTLDMLILFHQMISLFSSPDYIIMIVSEHM